MTTIAQALAAEHQRWAVVIRIEGVGLGLGASDLTAAGNDARYRWCSYVPDYAAAEPASLWQPLLTELPSVVSERADPLGGRIEQGALTFSLVDEGDILTSLLRTDRAPVTSLTVAPDADDTTLTMASTSGLATGSLVFVGGECMRVVTVDSGTVATVSRGHLATRAAPHDSGDRVFLSTPILETRRVVLQLVPIDADSASDTLDLGSYVIDEVSWDSDVNVWTFSARTQGPYLDRVVPYEPLAYRVGTTSAPDDGSGGAIRGVQISGPNQSWNTPFLWGSGEAGYLRRGESGEVVAIEGSVSSFRITRRDVVDSGREEWKPGDIFWQVYVGSDSFRYSPAPSPSNNRSSGTWIISPNWIDILLCVMTSSHDRDDGFDPLLGNLSNYNSTYGNWSCLPFGYGLGIPHAEINWPAFLAVKQRTLDYQLPNLVYGATVEPFAVWAEREILKPLGAFWSVTNGQASIVLPRTPLAEEASLVIGTADILAREVGPGLLSPRAKVSRGTAQQLSEVVYALGQGEPTKAVLSDAGYRDTFGARGVFSTGGPSVLIEVPGARRTDKALWARRGVAQLWRAHRPRLRLAADLAMNQTAQDWAVGGLAAVTCPELPNMRDATRGWTAVQCQLLEKNIVFEASRDDEDGGGAGVYVEATAQAYSAAVRVGRICPAAYVESSASNVATCTTNLYTQADVLNELPNTDVAGFEVGDVCTLVDAAGVVNPAAGTETVVAVDTGADEIEFSGDFNGELGPGAIVVFAGAGDASTNQRNRFVFIGGETTHTIAGSGDPAWVFGES